MSPAADLLRAAAIIDGSPQELLNGAASSGLKALSDSAEISQKVAAEKGVDQTTVQALWTRASKGLESVGDDLDVAAADAAVLLYAAGWFLQTETVATADLDALL